MNQIKEIKAGNQGFEVRSEAELDAKLKELEGQLAQGVRVWWWCTWLGRGRVCVGSGGPAMCWMGGGRPRIGWGAGARALAGFGLQQMRPGTGSVALRISHTGGRRGRWGGSELCCGWRKWD